MTEKAEVGLVEGGFVIPETLRVKVCLGILLLELLILEKVIEFSIELKVHSGEDARLVPVIEAHEVVLDIVRIVGNVILKLPVEVIEFEIVIEKS